MERRGPPVAPRQPMPVGPCLDSWPWTRSARPTPRAVAGSSSWSPTSRRKPARHRCRRARTGRCRTSSPTWPAAVPTSWPAGRTGSPPRRGPTPRWPSGAAAPWPPWWRSGPPPPTASKRRPTGSRLRWAGSGSSTSRPTSTTYAPPSAGPAPVTPLASASAWPCWSAKRSTEPCAPDPSGPWRCARRIAPGSSAWTRLAHRRRRRSRRRRSSCFAA